ncbi:ATPase, T2SS/T4P/T4SS family [Enterobacter kobei]|uniref:GspE/PulE family protein n=1 Tax=Enterobacteriaceae TaxID=543 RepID=UPI000DCC6DB2|nr:MULTISPECIES: ATPase, T2SS/T4P/T4SS family [Enterobacteriaceae]QXB24119.1 Flp pilus assembly complex ATPase component TadA [Lelliottia amnigena]RAY66721.1 ATP-binding protein [Enterobacter kobei]HBM0953160.1 Flp pilus assembly complex ATPase component TadA [Enterobacter kobei]HBM0982949.1 Flp pilus assembly complex ATPase component TadA [Enterobacter kobei]HCI5455882.1 Flp pilus assembly complex ATPase component TadA [Enterobacter kobei]
MGATTVESLLLVMQGDSKEILIDTNQRGDPAVQSDLMDLMSKYPGIKHRFVSLSDLREARKVQGAQPIPHNKDGLTLADIKGDSSHSEQRILNYFSVARTLNSSDIHFLISDSLFQVKMRIHGELHVVDERQREEGMSLCATCILSMSDVAETSFYPHREQDARLSPAMMRKIGLFGARYSHRPTGDGLIAVMRLIPDDGNKVPNFLQLGYLPEQIRLLTRMIFRPEGKIILSGPTGSGKSTTLRTACRLYLDTNPGRHLLTIEDPLEGQVVGAVQTPIVCDKSDEESVRVAWGKAISSALRLDPDAIMEGEMRDLVSMLATIYAAQTGHLVMTTLHTNSALGIPERMVTMGVKEDLLCDAQLLIGLISQRLVPTLCPACRISWKDKVPTLSDEEKHWLEKYCNVEDVCSTDNLYFHNPEGCDACTQVVNINGQVRGKVGQGIKGRTVIAEVIETNNRLFKLLKADGKVAARQYWISHMQGISRVRHVLHKINDGLVDPLMANRIIPLDEDERLEVDDA